MKLDQVIDWLLEEKAATDSILTDSEAELFRIEPGLWVRADDQWTRPDVQVYRGSDPAVRLVVPATNSRGTVEAFLAEWVLERPFQWGIYPQDAKKQAQAWAGAALGDFFANCRPESDIDTLVSTVASRLWEDAHADTRTSIETVLLTEPRCDVEITIDGVRLREPSGDDLVLSRSFPQYALHVPTTFQMAFPKSVLEWKYEIPLDEQSNTQGRLNDLLVGLMLVDASFTTLSGLVQRTDSYRDPAQFFSPAHGEKWSGSNDLDGNLLGEAIRLADLFNQSDTGIKRACRRILRSTRDHTDPSDRVTDLVIAMESLLTHEAPFQARYQFRMLGSLLLADGFDERIELKKILGNAYDERSGIVHSNKMTDWDSQQIEALAGIARRLCSILVEQGRPDYDQLILG